MDTREQENEYKENDDLVEVYKKWFKSSTDGGFLSVKHWPQADKTIIDIGTVRNGALESNAKCYVPTDQFIAYLEADVHGYAKRLYPNFFSTEPAKAGLAFYGGTTKGGPPIARVFKIVPWQDNDDFGRAFKCGWFEGEALAQGAIKPNYSKPIRNEKIKVTMPELAVILENLRTQVIVSKIEALVFEDSDD